MTGGSAFRQRTVLLVSALAVTVLVALGLAATYPRDESADTAPIMTATLFRETKGIAHWGMCQGDAKHNLRFGPGLNYPVYTNIPVRPQPSIHILDAARAGLIRSNGGQCNPRDEGWWWLIQVSWMDTGDLDQGWLWQGEFKACE
jgi:hypothetical protein